MIYTYDIYIDGIYRLWYIHIYMIWCMYYMVYIGYMHDIVYIGYIDDMISIVYGIYTIWYRAGPVARSKYELGGSRK